MRILQPDFQLFRLRHSVAEHQSSQMFERVEVAGRFGHRAGLPLDLCKSCLKPAAPRGQRSLPSQSRATPQGPRAPQAPGRPGDSAAECATRHGERHRWPSGHHRPPPMRSLRPAGRCPTEQGRSPSFRPASRPRRRRDRGRRRGPVAALHRRETRSPESIPRENEPFSQRIQMIPALRAKERSRRHCFTSRRAASSASSGVLRTDPTDRRTSIPVFPLRALDHSAAAFERPRLANSSSAGPKQERYRSTPAIPAAWCASTRARTALRTCGSTSSQ